MKVRRRLAAVTWICGLGLLTANAAAEASDDPLIGAEAALRQWQEKPATTDQTAAPPVDPLRTELDALTRAWPTLGAPEAAAQWLALYDRWRRQATKFHAGQHQAAPVAFSDLVRAIPGPTVWPELLKQAEALPVPASPPTTPTRGRAARLADDAVLPGGRDPSL